MIVSNQVLIAFGLTLFAGASTGIGSAIALLSKKTNTSFLSLSLGFSAGVMIFVSFVELFHTSQKTLSEIFGDQSGFAYACLAFFAGVLLIAIIDKLIPERDNPHEFKDSSDFENGAQNNKGLMRVGIVTALVIAIHNFPEGMVTFLSGLQDVTIAIPIAIAIAIHNIPEGISVSVPIYFATGNKRKAFWLSFLSGLAEPAGAVIGYLLFAQFLNETVMGIMFGIISGIMVFISLDELLPAAEKYGKHHIAIYGVIAGMTVMALSLILFL